MVKKTSILDKLKNRWKSPSGMRLEREGGGARDGATSRFGGVQAAEAQALATPEPDRASGRKLSAKEEAVMAMGEGFRELSNLVRGVHTRMEDQGERATGMVAEIRRLPALGQAQLEVLQQMAEKLERQNLMGDRLASALCGLPDTLHGLQKTLEKVAATDERTASTMVEFRQTMDRIQGAMGDMVDRSAQQAQGQRELVEAVREGRQNDVKALGEAIAAQREGEVDRLERATSGSLEAVRKAQEQQTERLDKLARDGSRWSNVIVVLLSLTFLALACILGVLVAS